tara:strand:- start:251 stop:451 length:201 start_codon:yes stop_codon:yes gene_type:complete
MTQEAAEYNNNEFYSNQLEKVVNAARAWKEAVSDKYISYSEIDHISEKLKEAIEDLDLLTEDQKQN